MTSSPYRPKGQYTKQRNASCDLEVTQDQAFSCTKANTSKTSFTPPLNITLFICFQISLTIAIQIAPQISFTEADALQILNWEKFNKGIWNVLCTPNHAQQRFHKSHTNLHSKNRCEQESSSDPQKMHTELTTLIPHFSKLTLVANLSSNTLQTVTCAAGTTLHFQNFINSLFLSPTRLPRRRRYPFNRIPFLLPFLPLPTIFLPRPQAHSLNFLRQKIH